MKNKGYTLIELLGVMIILALIIVLVFPSIINSINSSNNKKDKLTTDLIISATESFIDNNSSDFYEINGEVYCISIKTLIENNYLKENIELNNEDITQSKSVKVSYTDEFDYQIVASSSCKQIARGKFLSEYQPVEYIENNGTQYIDTTVIPNSSTGVDIVYQTSAIDKSQYIMGVRENAIHYAVNGSSSRTDWDIRFDGATIYSNVARTTDVWQSKISMQNGNGSWTLTNLSTNQSNSFAITNKTVTPTMSLHLFNYNAINPPYPYVHSNLKIYSCKIYDGQTLIRDFIPCYRKTDGVIGMYDLVEQEFYVNSGTGVFSKGEDVVLE